MPHSQFYLTTDDVSQLLATFEQSVAVYYVAAGRQVNGVQKFDSFLNLPSLGVAAGRQASLCDRYLVLPKETEVVVRSVQEVSGIEVPRIDELFNPSAMTLCPAGRFGHEAMVAGTCATIGKHTDSKMLYAAFARCLKKSCTPADGVWVGPQAADLARRGVCQLGIATL